MLQPVKPGAGGDVARHIAASGMALTVCLLSLMLFRGVFSLLQALIIPLVIVLMTVRQPWTYHLAIGIALPLLTLVFFPTQIVFVMLYLLMTLVLMKLLAVTQNASRLGYLLFMPYLLLNSLLLFIGLKVTDFVFLTPLHAMMMRLSGGSLFRYAAIMVMEAAFVSGLHLVFVLFFRRRLRK